MPAALRRHLIRTASLAVAAGLLAVPASASAKTSDPLAGARINSAAGSLDIVTFRCPPGEGRSSPKCGQSRLELSFKTGPKPAPRNRRVANGAVRLSGTGRGECTSLSPSPDPLTSPDGGMQLLGPASRIEPLAFDHTDIAVAATGRTIRWTWLEPTAPTEGCEYAFGGGATTYPEAAESPRFRLAMVKRRRFTVTLSANVAEFEQTAADGSKVFGDATWKLTLNYRRG